MRANNGAVDEAFHRIIKMVLSRELRPGDSEPPRFFPGLVYFSPTTTA